MALADLLIYAGVAIFSGALGAVILIQIRLRHYVSKEKVHAVEDVSQLWEYRAPPKMVLNEKGLRLYGYGWVLIVIFLISVGIVFFVVNYGTPNHPNNLLIYFAGVAVVVGMFFEARLKHYVSKEKVHAVKDVSQLWKYSVPPEIVLNEKGLRLYHKIWVSVGIFLMGVGMMLFGAIYW